MKRTRNKPQIGQELFGLDVPRHGRGEASLRPLIVHKVGRLYFYAGLTNTPQHCWSRYDVKTWKSDGYLAYSLYASPQEWEDDKEERALCAELHAAFESRHNRFSVPLESLRQMHAMIYPTTPITK